MMACRLLLPKLILTYHQLDSKEQSSAHLFSHIKFLIEENTFENAVCKTAAISSRSECIKAYCCIRMQCHTYHQHKINESLQ